MCGQDQQEDNLQGATMQRPKSSHRRWICRLIFWLGMALIALLAVPTGVLVLVIVGIWTGVEKITNHLLEQPKQQNG